MASLDPSVSVLRSVNLKSSGRFQLRIHDIQPENIEPNGDRYVVEAIDLDETILLGSLLVVTQTPPDRSGDPMADPTVERRGVIAAVVIRAGSGHLLGLPDLGPMTQEAASYHVGDRPWACVDMFYEPGEVVLIDHTAKGRALKILGREIRIVNQIDILGKIEGVRLKRKNETWAQEE